MRKTPSKRRQVAALRLVRDLLALVGDTRLSANRRTGEITLTPPGQLRRDRGKLWDSLPAALVSAAALCRQCGIDEDEVAGLVEFAALITREGPA